MRVLAGSKEPAASGGRWRGGLLSDRSQVAVEEGHDPLAGVGGRRLMVAGRTREPAHHHEDQRTAIPSSLVVIEELVPSVRVLLDVMVHTDRLQDAGEPLGGPPIGPVPGTIAADDGTGARQDALGIGILGD